MLVFRASTSVFAVNYQQHVLFLSAAYPVRESFDGSSALLPGGRSTAHGIAYDESPFNGRWHAGFGRIEIRTAPSPPQEPLSFFHRPWRELI